MDGEVTYGGEGKCQTKCPEYDGLLCCYVQQPTTCTDIKLSTYQIREMSAEACEDFNRGMRLYCIPNTKVCTIFINKY